MVNFGPLAAEILSLVWGTPANFNGFRVLAALLHGTLVVDVSETLRRWTEGATYVRQGGHDVGHWPTFLVCFSFRINCRLVSYNLDLRQKAVRIYVHLFWRRLYHIKAYLGFLYARYLGMRISFIFYTLFMVALCNRADHYIFALWFLSFFLSFFFFCSPNLSGRRLDVYHTSTHGVALVWI